MLSENESIDITLHCEFVSCLWQICTIKLSVYISPDTNCIWMRAGIRSPENMTGHLLVAAICWTTWRERKNRIFRGHTRMPEECFYAILLDIGHWTGIHSEAEGQRRNDCPPPPQDYAQATREASAQPTLDNIV